MREEWKRLGVRALLAAGVGVTLLGGLTAGGCGSSAKVESRGVSVGQELQDLDEARNKGLLTEDEYNTKREEILKRR